MDVLTRELPKPTLPYAGAFRLGDVPLSNPRNSGVSDVWVSVQYLGQALTNVMANGKPWDLDRHRGGFRVIMPEQAGSPAEEGFVSGNAEHLLPAMVLWGRVHAYRLPGYWRDLGRPETYLAAHRELLAGEVPLFDPDWPITTTVEKRAPARMHLGCTVADSMISDGCEIFGAVRNSVLGPGVVVEAGGQVRDSVIFADVIVRSGATVDWAIVDHDCEIGSGAMVGSSNPGGVLDSERIALLGPDCRIEPEPRSAGDHGWSRAASPPE